jgi:hypothetical protein
MKIYKDLFNRIISLENLVLAWEEFRVDKGKKIDVQEFEFSLEQNIFSLTLKNLGEVAILEEQSARKLMV